MVMTIYSLFSIMLSLSMMILLMFMSLLGSDSLY